MNRRSPTSTPSPSIKTRSTPSYPGRAQLYAILQATILDNPYIPQRPTNKQAQFLVSPQREVFFGGAAGGAKSSALLMAALQYVHVPDYSALLLRRTYADLSLPQAIMSRAHEWLQETDAKWNDKEKTWTFPSGATLTFGYLDAENDKYRYQGAELKFCGFDELTQFSESQYLYLFSRLRRGKDSNLPIRMRGAGNPGGIGHGWVRQRFIVEGEREGRLFIPSRLDDNPYLDRAEYEESLRELDPVTREQLLHGDWDVRPPGAKFRREWFEIVDEYPRSMRVVRFWDLAATEPRPGTDPDWTAGCKIGESDGVYYVVDMRRVRTTPAGVEALIRQTATIDGHGVDVYMEQEPGSSGVNTIDHYRRRVLKGYTFRGIKSTGSKEVRANPVSSAAEAGNVKLVRGTWINDFLDEVEVFPQSGMHDDQCDALSGGFSMLNRGQSRLFVPSKAPDKPTAQPIELSEGLQGADVDMIPLTSPEGAYLPLPAVYGQRIQQANAKKRDAPTCEACGEPYSKRRGNAYFCETHGWQQGQSPLDTYRV